MGCENCLQTKKGQDEALSNILFEAKQYATENNISVAIYQEGYEYFFTDAEQAIKYQYNIRSVLSKHS